MQKKIIIIIIIIIIKSTKRSSLVWVFGCRETRLEPAPLYLPLHRFQLSLPRANIFISSPKLKPKRTATKNKKWLLEIQKS